MEAIGCKAFPVLLLTLPHCHKQDPGTQVMTV